MKMTIFLNIKEIISTDLLIPKIYCAYANISRAEVTAFKIQVDLFQNILIFIWPHFYFLSESV